MKRFIAFLLCAAVWVTPATAQTQHTQTQTHAGRTKIWVGAALAVTGAFVLPITAANDGHMSASKATGLALISAGGVLVFWGFNERRRPMQPHTIIGVTVGRASGVRIRRVW